LRQVRVEQARLAGARFGHGAILTRAALATMPPLPR
jgi:hypothetical protein